MQTRFSLRALSSHAAGRRVRGTPGPSDTPPEPRDRCPTDRQDLRRACGRGGGKDNSRKLLSTRGLQGTKGRTTETQASAGDSRRPEPRLATPPLQTPIPTLQRVHIRNVTTNKSVWNAWRGIRGLDWEVASAGAWVRSGGKANASRGPLSHVHAQCTLLSHGVDSSRRSPSQNKAFKVSHKVVM